MHLFELLLSYIVLSQPLRQRIPARQSHPGGKDTRLELDEQISAYSEPAEERIHNSIRMKKFLGLVQQLDPDDRAALLMRTQDEMSFAEIGKKLGIRPEAAKMRVHRAKRRLMEMI